MYNNGFDALDYTHLKMGVYKNSKLDAIYTCFCRLMSVCLQRSPKKSAKRIGSALKSLEKSAQEFENAQICVKKRKIGENYT